jgi:hypothetical protein
MLPNVGEVVGNKDFYSLDFNYYSDKPDRLKKAFAVEASRNDQEQLMISAKEVYLAKRIDEHEIAFGRKILNWSDLDKIWGFGHVNNRRNFDFFEPGQEGLTGLNYNARFSSGISLSAFVSFLYIPEMNPGMKLDLDKGTVKCQNPWCSAPAETAPVEGVDRRVFYDINYPEISDVIFKYSAGLSIGYNRGPYSMDTFWVRKPENQLSVLADIKYDVQKQMVFVEVDPKFYYHDVIGTNVRYQYKKYTIYAAALSVFPNQFPEGAQPYIENIGLKPEKKEEQYLGFGARVNSDVTFVGLNYVARVSEFDKENDILIQYPRWNQALNLDFGTRLTRKLSVYLDYKFDMLTDDRLTMFKVNYDVNSSLAVAAGANVIAAPSTESFWSDFSNNDAVFSSLKYIF